MRIRVHVQLSILVFTVSLLFPFFASVSELAAADAALVVLQLAHEVPVALAAQGRGAERLVTFAGGAVAGRAARGPSGRLTGQPRCPQ